MGLSVVNKLEIDDVNYHFARRISYVASTRVSTKVSSGNEGHLKPRVLRLYSILCRLGTHYLAAKGIF